MNSNLDISNWKTFKIKDIADVYKSKSHSKIELTVSEERQEGFVPFVTRTIINNGVDCYVPSSELTLVEKGNAIIVGDTTATVFYQPDDFGTGEHIIVIRAPWMNVYTAMFVVALLQREKFRYSYGRAFLMDSIKETSLRLPVNEQGEPCWTMVEEYIKTLKWTSIECNNSRKEKINLKDCAWGEFLVGDIFYIINGKGITREEIDDNPGELAAVQSGEENNGVLGKISKEYCKTMNYNVYEKPCLTVARSGSSGFVSFQKDGCVVGDSAKILILKDEKASYMTGVFLFLQTILSANRFKYAYGRKVTESKYLNEIIKLPICTNEDGSVFIDENKKYSEKGYVPNWIFMDKFIKSLPYGDKI